MITKIEIKNVATYGNDAQIIDGLKKLIIFMDLMDLEKTTVSKVIKDPSLYNDCCINWKDESELESFVYNTDFFDADF